MSARMPARWRAWYQRWLQRRIPRARRVTLDQRRIFILPTGYGLLFLAVAVGLFVGGTNYENNMLMALSFMLVSIFMVAILHTYANLAGITLIAGSSRSGFVAGKGALQVRLLAGRKGHHALWLGFNGVNAQLVSVEAEQEQSIWLAIRLARRGYNHPGRIRVVSRYPLGLLRSWSLVELDHACLAWPKPLPGGECPAQGGSDQAGKQRPRDGVTDFDGLRAYASGDSLKRIDWKSYARGGALNTKLFSDPAEGRLWLDFQLAAGYDPETRYSKLCHWVLELDQQGLAYGLRLPDAELAPGKGVMQREQALDMLALSGQAH